jgi:hypothetical protein
MHTLIYNGVNFSTLGPELEMMGQTSVLEPPEAPQYRRTTLRCRYSFFETTWEDNYGLIEKVRNALKTQQGALQWLDDDGNTVIQRRVIVGPHDLPDANSQGTYRQQVNFSFTYLEFPSTDGIVPNTMAATWTAAGGGPVVTLSTVEHWTEGMDTKTYSEWRPDRRRVAGSVTASGRILGNSLASLAASQAGLFAAKDQLMAQFQGSDNGTLVFGSFNRNVHGLKFEAMVDQAQDIIRWTLHAEFTYLPSEGNYAQYDVGIEFRNQLAAGSQGTTEIILSGKIESDSSAHAYSALASFQLAMVPGDYTQIETGNSERIVGGVDRQDTFIELSVRETYRQNKTNLVTWTPDVNGSMQTFGILESFSDGYSGQLFSEMRPERQRAGGVVQMTGRYQLGPGDETSALYETMAQWTSLLAGNDSGVLAYGGFFEQDVRIVSFEPRVMEGIMAITWTLVAHFTRFPNEAGYAVSDFHVLLSNIQADGSIRLSLNGKIEAQSQEAALAALAGIRQTAIPTPNAGGSWATVEQKQNSRTVIADADGTTFLEMSFSEEYRQTAGQLVNWRMKRTDQTNIQTGMIRSVFAGTVSAVGTTQAQAYSAALAQAQLLGSGQYPILLRSDITQVTWLYLTAGNQFVEVEFSFEYLRKGTAIYLEANNEFTNDTFGQDTETISGYCAGPTNAACLAAYQANLRNILVNQGRLILDEKTGYGQMFEQPAGRSISELDVRLSFTLVLHVVKQASETAMKYSIAVRQNFVELTQTTTIDGVVYGQSLAVAQAFLTAFLQRATPASSVMPEATTRQRSQTGANVGGNSQTDFFELEFSSTFLSLLSGSATVLESEVTVSVDYAGTRWIEQPIPGTVSIMQNTGVKPGRRRVSGRVKAATLAAAQNWAQAQHAFISGDPSGNFEEPQQIAATYEFLPLTIGVASGAGTNVRVYVINFGFSEVLPTLVYKTPFSNPPPFDDPGPG